MLTYDMKINKVKYYKLVRNALFL